MPYAYLRQRLQSLQHRTTGQDTDLVMFLEQTYSYKFDHSSQKDNRKNNCPFIYWEKHKQPGKMENYEIYYIIKRWTQWLSTFALHLVFAPPLPCVCIFSLCFWGFTLGTLVSYSSPKTCTLFHLPAVVIYDRLSAHPGCPTPCALWYRDRISGRETGWMGGRTDE